LEADTVTLLKRIRKFSMTQDIGARAAAHILIGLVSLLLKDMLIEISLITHLLDHHCNGHVQAIIRHSLTTNIVVFEAADVMFKHIGSDFVPPPDYGDGVVTFVIYDLTKPQFQLHHVNDLVQGEQDGFTLALLKSLLSKGLCTVSLLFLPLCLLKTFCPVSNLDCVSLQLVTEALAEPSLWSQYLTEGNLD
ncbi:hypothetical protein Tco_1123431, partial [Tanacetum coccineum]